MWFEQQRQTILSFRKDYQNFEGFLKLFQNDFKLGRKSKIEIISSPIQIETVSNG